jgi:hypothetical protein
MLDCMGEPEDADPAKVRSVSRGCGEFGINRLKRVAYLQDTTPGG